MGWGKTVRKNGGRGIRQRFVAELLSDPGRNATQAYIRAGGSAKTAKVNAHELLQLPDVKDLISKAETRRLKKLEIKGEDVLRELHHVAHSDIAEIINPETGCLRPVHEIPEHARRAIASIEVEELFEKDGEGGQVLIGYLRKVKFWDKNKGAELLGKNKKLWTDKIEHSGTVVQFNWSVPK